MSKSKKVSPPVRTPPKRVLCDGVGFNPVMGEYGIDKTHYVAMMISIHSGVEVFGPFLTETAAHEWIREHGDGEMYERFGRNREPGVTFVVKWLDVPVNYLRD